MRGNIGVCGLLGILILSAVQPAQAIKRLPYEKSDALSDYFDSSFQTVASEYRKRRHTGKDSTLFQSIVSVQAREADELAIVSYSDDPRPRAVVRWKIAMRRQPTPMALDPYIKALRRRPAFGNLQHVEMLQAWSEALLAAMTAILEHESHSLGSKPWIIELTHDEYGKKKAGNPPPTQTVHQLNLSITSPDGVSYYFDRTTEFSSILGMASLVLEVVENHERFIKSDGAVLTRLNLPGKATERWRGRRFLKTSRSLPEYLDQQSRALCKLILESDPET